MPGYVELHARSAFSFLRGGSRAERLAEVAAERGLPAMALCDRMGLYGSPRFAVAAREMGVRAIHGAELVMEDGAVFPVLVESRRGYQNLCELLTRAHLRSPKGEGRVRWDELGEFTSGLVALTSGDEGPLTRAILASGTNPGASPASVLERMVRAFGREGVFVELQRHHTRGEDRVEERLVELARAQRLPLIATNGVLHASPGSRRVVDVFTCLRHHTTLDAAGTLLSRNAERHVKSAGEMAALFPDLPEAIDNTTRLAERLQFSLDDLGYEFPRFPVGEGQTMPGVLREWAWRGAHERYGADIPEKVRALLEKELALIHKLGFDGYFLLVADLVRFCRENDILAQGRGSAANSAVCFCLGITAVDPVKFNVLFERFLSEGRKGWPDIDIDLPSGDRREKVIQEVYRRYGPHGAAMTGTVISYRGRSSARELGKVLGFPADVLDRFSALFASGDFPHTLELIEQLKQAGLPPSHPRAAAFADLYQQMSGLPRHLGQHTGGMIICQGALHRVVPLENASMPGRVVCQWDKDDCEELGIIKVDLLGLGMMSVLQDAVKLTEARGHPVDLAQLPTDDPKTFEAMRRADTIGVFQIESRAQMATLPRLKPTCFYDLVVEVAIIRPGPIQGDLAHPYLRRREGADPVTYWDDRLRPVLERTLGVPLFQEQMLQIAMVMANFSGTEAEELRKALSFHRSDERMRRSQARLREAMAKQGVPEATAEQIARAVGSFALYGFPESHAISFAHLAYASAFLKVHRPAEFYCALLNNQPMGFYAPATLVKDAKRHGVRVRPVCVLCSRWECMIEEDGSLRLGLLQVQGLNRTLVDQMLAQREARPFASLDDFKRRTRFSRTQLRTLAEIGALNELAGHRRAALWEVERAVSPGELFETSGISDSEKGRAKDAPGIARGPTESPENGISENQLELGRREKRSAPAWQGPLLPMTPLERTAADYAGLRLTTGPHPMALIRSQLSGVWTAMQLQAVEGRQRVKVAGQVICRQRPGTAKGVCFISLEDETGVANVIVRPKLFEAQRLRITSEPYLLISGMAEARHGTVHVHAECIDWLEFPELPGAESHDFR